MQKVKGKKDLEDEINEKIALKEKMKEIKDNKPTPNSLGDYVKSLVPSTDNDLIKYYNRLNESIKDNFRKHLKKGKDVQTLEEAPSFQDTKPDSVALGKAWDNLLSKRIDGKKISEAGDEKVADALFGQLKTNFGIELLVSHMPLYGYMYSEESDQVYFWNGDADAVGLYNNKYVIVDWKVLDLLEYWDKSYAFGKHLHQCLVYARLLQLHLDLDYLPSILIVPISSNDGKQIHPGFFSDYPEECKKVINDFLWPIEQPAEPPRNIVWNKDLFSDKVMEGSLDEEMEVKDFFANGVKMKDVLKALGFTRKLKIKKPKDK